MQIVGFATLGLLGFDVVCIIISLAIDYWILLDIAGSKVFTGLWKLCTEVASPPQSNVICVNIQGSTELNVVRAMLFLGLFLVCGAIACVALKLFVLKEKRELLFGAAGLLAFAGVFLMVGFAVYHAKIFKPLQRAQFTLHVGFAFCIIAWLLTWAGAGTSLTMMIMTSRES